MSQAKVDQHKYEKANRKKIVKKQKMARFAGKAVAWVIALALLAGIGSSIYGAIENKRPAKTYYANLEALESYTDSLQAE